MTTICAPATAPGGAIAIIRISGPEAITIAARIFHPASGKPLTEAKPQSLHFGQIVSTKSNDPSVPCGSVAGHGEEKSHLSPTNSKTNNLSPSPVEEGRGGVVDEALASVFRAPHSYTGEDSVELSCHASPYIINKVLELLIANGAHLAQPGEFTQRAFLNGKMDLSQAEAVADLIASKNAATHRIAMQQMRGGYSQKLSTLRAQLLEITSLLELELDFSEEDVEFADRQKLILLAEEIQAEITHLTSSFRLGNALKNGVPVAIIGAPNVGKSTLLNALLKDDRAIVSDIQGTTRDLIEDTVTINDITFRFIDTAGIRHTNDTIERLGIERSRQAAERAQIIIMMNEPGVDFPEIETRPEQTIIRITNKTTDFQALNGTGLAELEEKLLASVKTTDSDALLVTNLRHYEALNRAQADITRALTALRQNLSADLVSEDLRQCLSNLAEITGGPITTDEVLGNIFKNFCIGK